MCGSLIWFCFSTNGTDQLVEIHVRVVSVNSILASEDVDHFFSREVAAIGPDGGPKLQKIAIFLHISDNL